MVTVVRRLGTGKEQVRLPDAAHAVPAVLDEVQAALLRRAEDFRQTNTRTVEEWSAFTDAVATGWALAFGRAY